MASRRHRYALVLSLPLLLAACGGRPLPGERSPPPNWVALPGLVQYAQYQPGQFQPNLSTPIQPGLSPAPRTPPVAPAHPPTSNTQNFGNWQREGNGYRWAPGDHPAASGSTPFWVPGHWTTDSSGARVYAPGYWR
ncbi:MAG TPA: hypothetical protein VHA10_07105 [Hypericibacter adhaerens]|jgi:hypothetical protein|uniref:Lipoprotein n=1 Tax=Hypericibacter adhaerens TaxID=2602016 RepID=A0A5J6MTY6_9PROT|nr:hypothetical protein [Hypericibacter adhaerens]QEX20809.1 hypothetical protein FRZ61_07290 [Hypericibacter adhaerens]HWA42961.1 hypothetical protein [Hypericibacter adhaerens]HWA79137.1 hypothetical protein [Acetobacteraceae bacterium]